MEKQKSVKKNYLYNLIYQVFLLIIPLIVTPYVSRVLLAEGIGKYTFSLSVVTFFTLFAAFGFSYYAQREIAAHSGDKEKQSQIFWEIFFLKLITTSISLLVFGVLVASQLLSRYNTILTIMLINIAATGLDIAYLFQGHEDFKKLVLINILTRVLAIISIFVFVKSYNDLWLYALIQALALILPNVIMFLFIPKYLSKVDFKKLNIKRHFFPALKLFIPTIAISIYGLLDKILIGFLSTDAQVGYYEQAEKVVKIAMTIVTSLSAVMIPNNAKYYAKKDYKKLNSNVETAIKFSLFIGLPIMFGLMATARSFVPWFFGSGYMPCINIICILSVLIFSIGLNNVFGIQYLIPTNKEKIFTISVVIGAVCNLILNVITIPFFGAIGAAVATIIAETSILAYQVIYLRKEFSIIKIFKSCWKFLIASLVVVLALALNLAPTILNTVLLIVLGAAIYFVLLLVLKDQFLIQMIKKVLNFKGVNMFKEKLKKLLRHTKPYQKAVVVKSYVKNGTLKGGFISNYIKYYFKLKYLDNSTYKNYNINYPTKNYKHFYYHIDTMRYCTENKNEMLPTNMPIDYSLVVNNSLAELHNKYPNNDFVNLLLQESKKLCALENNPAKEFFELMQNSAATSFADALQRTLFANQIVWQTRHSLMGLGRLDVMLDKFYVNDIDKQKINKTQAKELLQEFFTILHENYAYKSQDILGDTGQIIILGGKQIDGSYFCNDLTYLILDSLVSLSLPDPKILLRVSQNMPKDLLEFATKMMAKGTGSPLLSNDDVIIKNMIDFGYDEQGAYNYATAACWEVTPLGEATEFNNFDTLDYVKILNKTLQRTTYSSFDEVLTGFKDNLIEMLNEKISKAEAVIIKRDPCIAFFVNENKNDNFVNAKYNNFGILTVGISNAVNALINVNNYVFTQKKYTLEEMNAKLNDANFLNELKNNNLKFGEDDNFVVALTNTLINMAGDHLKEYNKTHTRKFKTGFSSPAYITESKNVGASLDGRQDKEPYNVHISSSKPIAYTELINFACKLNYNQPILNGNVIDFSTTPELINENLSKFVKLFEVAINKGFYQLQANVVSSKQLIEAKNDPTKYPNLIVRVWGFSAYFNDLSEEYKDVLIKRTQMYESANK